MDLAPPSISEETIMDTLGFLLDHSEAGASVHQMHVFSGGPDAVGPLGTVDENKVHSQGYMIAPMGGIDIDSFIQDLISRVSIETRARRERVLFAALSLEAWSVKPMDDLGHELLAKGRLFEHPNMIEETIVYGAAADGRRWTGRRLLTGPRAGTTEYADVMVGAPTEREQRPEWNLLRQLVGQRR